MSGSLKHRWVIDGCDHWKPAVLFRAHVIHVTRNIVRVASIVSTRFAAVVRNLICFKFIM